MFYQPNCHVYNNKCLQGPKGEPVCERLLRCIGESINQEGTAQCQRETKARDPGCGCIAACASCNKVLFECDNNITQVHINDLPKSFHLTKEQLIILCRIPNPIVEKFVSVLKHKKTWYHLNPDLVPDRDNVVLCKVCCQNPLNHPYSIANGHDYGRTKHFVNLNQLELATVQPIRPYNINLLLRANHSTGHSICFPSNGPTQLAKELPNLDPDRQPQITFLGPNETWRITKEEWKKLYTINTDNVYKALQIWKALNNRHFENVEVIDTNEMRTKLEMATMNIFDEAILGKDEDTPKEETPKRVHRPMIAIAPTPASTT